MADAKNTPPPTDEPIELAKTAAPAFDSEYLTTTEERAYGHLFMFEFPDGTSAKAWTDDKHFGVQLRDLNGRGYSDSTHTGLTLAAANTLIGDAGQKAKDQAAADAATS